PRSLPAVLQAPADGEPLLPESPPSAAALTHGACGRPPRRSCDARQVPPAKPSAAPAREQLLLLRPRGAHLRRGAARPRPLAHPRGHTRRPRPPLPHPPPLDRLLARRRP